MVRHWWRLRSDGSRLARRGRDQRDRRGHDRRRRRRGGAVEVRCSARGSCCILIPILIAHDAVHPAPVPLASAAQLAVRADVVIPRPRREERVVVPVPGINRAVVQAINVGRSIAPDVRGRARLRRPRRRRPGSASAGSASCRTCRWSFVESPYRALVGPLLAYLDVLDQAWPRGQGRARSPSSSSPSSSPGTGGSGSSTTSRPIVCGAALLGRPHTVVVNVPYRRETPRRYLLVRTRPRNAGDARAPDDRAHAPRLTAT